MATATFKSLLISIAAFGAIALPVSSRADIAFRKVGGIDEGATNEVFWLHISGTISRSDLRLLSAHFKGVVSDTGKPPAYIAILNSRGGSIESALGIGRLLRKSDSLAQVQEGSVCFSSCVFILAGAARRGVWGTVGIHRPYEPNDQTLSSSQQKLKYEKIGKQVTKYLREMNIPTRLYDDSLFISPENIKILNDNELQSYGLSANDPYGEEADAVEKAQRLGISRKALAEREAQVKHDCPLPDETSRESMLAYIKCSDRIIKGF